MVVSGTCSSAQNITSADHSDLQRLYHLIANNVCKEDLSCLVGDQEFKQYTAMAGDGSPISVIHSLPSSNFDVQGFAQLFNPGHARSSSDIPQNSPGQPPYPPARTASLPQPLPQHRHQHNRNQHHDGSSVPRSQPDPHWTNMAPPAQSQTMSTKPKPAGFTCNFCLEEGLALACTRKNDLKRHIEDFHHTNSQWLCPIPECGMAFDWESAFKFHTKSQHEALRIKPMPCKVSLCEQVVFACGFETCMQVFEASSDGGSAAKFKDYLAHVIKHYDEGLTSGQWSYSRRMRNLLRQSAMRGAWSSIEEGEGPYHMMQWDPQNSNVLRKKLETRHIVDIQGALDAAIALGWLPDKPCEAHPGLDRPLRQGCAMPIIGHAHSAATLPLPPLHALPLSITAPVHYGSVPPAQMPLQQYYAHAETCAAASYTTSHAPDASHASVPAQHEAVYSPQLPPMYMASTGASADYCQLPAEYGAFTTSPSTPLYKTLPQMMRDDEQAAQVQQAGMTIDPQLYMDWTTSPRVAFGSPVVKDEMEMDGEGMFPPLETDT